MSHNVAITPDRPDGRQVLDRTGLFEREFDEHARVVQRARGELARRFDAVTGLCAEALRSGHKLLFFGNGGSAADAQHFAAELVVRYRRNRRALPAVALTTDSSILTAGGNDLGFDQIFARQIEALGRPGDVAVGSSTSGKSPNVLRAFAVARKMGLRTVALTGSDGGGLAESVDELLVVPSTTTARIQEVHLLIGHLLCEALELELATEEVKR
jgi:D-sedoheptulose 7-phosphate isomerase